VSTGAVPENPLLKNLERVLITREQIEARLAELGAEISRDYENESLILISILKGGIVFLADLSRRITVPHALDLIGATSYRGGTKTTGRVIITKDAELDLRGRHILLVEDVLDTGHTLNVVIELLRIQEPASIEICCLLDKKRPREIKVPVKYTGFEIGDEFVVGYGLDYKEHYRNLDCIAVLAQSAIEAN
jgi:hypoxanthine phosphoribosyltransferase